MSWFSEKVFDPVKEAISDAWDDVGDFFEDAGDVVEEAAEYLIAGPYLYMADKIVDWVGDQLVPDIQTFQAHQHTAHSQALWAILLQSACHCQDAMVSAK